MIRAALLLALVACGGSKDGTKPAPNNNNTDTPTTETGAETTTEPTSPNGTVFSENGQVDIANYTVTSGSGQRKGLAQIEVEVVDGVTAFQVTGQSGPGYSIYLERIIGPDGQDAIHWSDYFYADESITGGFTGETVMAVNWPIRAQDGPLSDGTYLVELSTIDQVSFGYVANKDIEVSVARKRDDDFSGGNVHVRIVWADGVDDDPQVKAGVEAGVERWRQLWARQGLILTETYQSSDLDPFLNWVNQGDQSVLNTIADKDLNELVLIVGEQIRNQNSTYGISAGIPGTIDTTKKSYVVLSWLVHAGFDGVFDQAETNLMGETMAHEVGHYMGLFHPVEGGYSDYDAITDTPRCANARQCDQALGTNNMYWTSLCDYYTCVEQNDITPGQLEVSNRFLATD